MRSLVWATGALLAFAAPSSATVDVFATIDKDKDILVFEDIFIFKDINIIADVISEPDSAAEANALLNQDNIENEACENCAEKIDTITNSVNANSGIVVTNQAAGSNNNQGSSIAVAVDFGGGGTQPDDPGEGSSFANAQASAEQNNTLNLIEAVNLIFRSASITDSINDNTGVVHVNQSVGNNNNQANGLAIAVGLRPDGGVAIAEADLGQFNTNNQNLESNDGTAPSIGINKDATLTGSVNGNTGVIGVNQTAGNMANQANIVAVAAASPNGSE
jgi:hypothetical protein